MSGLEPVLSRYSPCHTLFRGNVIYYKTHVAGVEINETQIPPYHLVIARNQMFKNGGKNIYLVLLNKCTQFYGGIHQAGGQRDSEESLLLL